MIENLSPRLQNYQQILTELRTMERANLAITLDWLTLYFTQPGFIPETVGEGDTIELSEDCYLVGIDRPTLHFKSCLVLIYKTQECATILCNSRNEKFFKPDVVKVDFTNHTLYSGIWKNVYDILLSFGLSYKTAGRIDIAIDGVNYLHSLMNIYAKQSRSNSAMKLKNSSEHRARFSAKVLNTDTLNFENFNIGNGGNYGKNTKGNSSGSNKMITIYNKSLEIVKSGKTYIQEWWLRNGIVRQAYDLEEMAEILEKRERKGEVFSLREMTTIYRFEIRLKSEAIKEIENFTVEMLTGGAGLASIVKLHCKKYFEGYFLNNVNVARCKNFDLLPYERLGAEKINKIARVENDGMYKAKLSIHSAIYDYYIGKTNDDKTHEVINTIKDKCNQYKLHVYLFDKLDEWNKKYFGAIHPDRLVKVILFKGQLDKWLSEFDTSEVVYLRVAHNQAGATAAFGEGVDDE